MHNFFFFSLFFLFFSLFFLFFFYFVPIENVYKRLFVLPFSLFSPRRVMNAWLAVNSWSTSCLRSKGTAQHLRRPVVLLLPVLKAVNLIVNVLEWRNAAPMAVVIHAKFQKICTKVEIINMYSYWVITSSLSKPGLWFHRSLYGWDKEEEVLVESQRKMLLKFVDFFLLWSLCLEICGT